LDENFIVSHLPFEGAEELTLKHIISSNTYLHYREHAQTFETGKK
jgi:hypothetical protein